jgi:hypothetical protein
MDTICKRISELSVKDFYLGSSKGQKRDIKKEYVVNQISYLSFCPDPITRILTRTTCFNTKIVYILLNAHSYEK